MARWRNLIFRSKPSAGNPSVRLLLHLVLLGAAWLLPLQVAEAQCDSNQGVVSASAVAGNPGGASLAYVLTDLNEQVLRVSTTASFSNVADGTYKVFALGYNAAAVPARPGTLISAAMSLDTTARYTSPVIYSVCTDALPCNSRTGTVTVQTSGTPTAGASLAFVLTDGGGTVLRVSATPSFDNIPSGTYLVYALGYVASSVPVEVGTSIFSASARDSCAKLSETPLLYKVCTDALPCTSQNGTISLTATGGSLGGASLAYVLTTGAGKVLRFNASPSFTNVPAGSYHVYALAYTTPGVPVSVGGSIFSAARTDGCARLSASPLLVNVCTNQAICDFSTGVVSVSALGGSAPAGGVLEYLLTDSTGRILQNSATASFSVAAPGTYGIYAIAYSGTAPYSLNQAVTTIIKTTTCIGLSPIPFEIRVCGTCLTVKVYLQGSILNNGEALSSRNEPLMRDDLRRLGLLPATTPYGSGAFAGFVQVSSPVSRTLSASLTAVTGDQALVDWVFVELRDRVSASQVRYTRSGLVQRDGTVVDEAGGCLNLSDVVAGEYHVSVRHRNHLGVMTAEAVSLGRGDAVVDFRTRSPQQIWDQGLLQAPLYADRERYVIPYAAGYFALWAGNANRNTTVIYQGQSNDPAEVFNQVGSVTDNRLNSPSYVLRGYTSGDVDMNGQTIFQGQNNEPAMIFNILALHPSNSFNSPSFVNIQQLP